MLVFSIKDIKSGLFNSPFTDRSIPNAMRVVMSTAQNEQSSLAKYPSDFELWKIAEFNEETGEFFNVHTHVSNVIDLVNVKRFDTPVHDGTPPPEKKPSTTIIDFARAKAKKGKARK